jgi:Glycosyl transferase family 2
MDLSLAEAALSRGNIRDLCQQLESLFPQDAEMDRVRGLVQYAVDGAAPTIATGEQASIFLGSISETRRILSGAPLPRLHHLRIGEELDFLSDRSGADGWTLEQSLNFLLLGRIRPTRRSVVVTAMRDDGIYILEWVAHYLSLGFDHIIVYTNDNADGSEELLRLLAGHAVITLIESQTSGTVPPESKGFGHALHLLHDLRDFEWALFVDSDEYFIPGPEYAGSIANLLCAIHSRFPDRVPSGVCYDWLWFVSGMAFKRTPDLLLERFQHARPHHLTKSLARIQDVLSMRRDHYPETKAGGLLVDSVFDPINLDSIYNKVPQYRGGQVNHYWARSFEEFAVKKARGSTMKMATNLYDRPFAKFFTWNDYETPQNHYLPDPSLLSNVKHQIERLKALEGVRTAAALIDVNFSRMVHLIADQAQLRKIYEESKTEPTAL